MKITATVPMRIDLAGGTLDVYPLYLFEGGGLTLNAAIDVTAAVTIETRDDARVSIRSSDLGLREEHASLDEMPLGHGLDLARRAVAQMRPPTGINVTMDSHAPKGSGLGASSALLMALLHALNALREEPQRLTSPQILDLGANLEAQVIGIPTGKQDYFPPIWGGVSALWFEVDGWRLEKLSDDRDLVSWLNQRVVVSYTSIPHDSAVTNWAMLKRYIEGEGDAVARMRDIKAIALAMRDALHDMDHARFVSLMDDEWQLRRGLAEGVSTPEIEAYMAAAKSAGADASKICGAGGGGCMVTLAAPSRQAQVRQALTDAGARVMDAHVVSQGIQLTYR
ncbi:MAG: hypothetical protein ACOX2R_08715 [Anaerolineae bacterium]|jgi:D-glycero-alpha-D-manno-heptose-7-phosphate kinase